MSVFTGIKPPSHKSATRYYKIENLPLPDEVILYASQHIGAPSKITVSKGDIVRRGQKLAEPAVDCSASLHASIGGKIKDI